MEKWSSQRIRELMTHIALRGIAANEVGCARISMMVRSMSSNTRPDTLVQDRTLQLAVFSCNARRVHTLGQTRASDTRWRYVRFTPAWCQKLVSCCAANRSPTRSPRRRGRAAWPALSYCLAAAPEPTFAHGITRLLTFAEK